MKCVDVVVVVVVVVVIVVIVVVVVVVFCRFCDHHFKSLIITFTPAPHAAGQPLGSVHPSGLDYIKLRNESADPQSAPGTRVVLAIAGKQLRLIKANLPEDYKKLLVGATVFARMSPDDKAQLVLDMQSLVRGVGICGKIRSIFLCLLVFAFVFVFVSVHSVS